MYGGCPITPDCSTHFVHIIPCPDPGVVTSGRRGHHGRVLVCRIIVAIRSAVDKYLLHDIDGNKIQSVADQEAAILAKSRYDHSDEFATIRRLCAELYTDYKNASMKSAKGGKADEDGEEDDINDIAKVDVAAGDTTENIKPLTTTELQSLFHQQLKGRYSDLAQVKTLLEALMLMVANVEEKVKFTKLQ